MAKRKGSLGGNKPRSGALGKARPATNRGKSQVQERRLADRFGRFTGAETTPNSGARPLPSQKGDLQGELFVWEAKRTEHRKLVITADVISKVTVEARRAPPAGKLPLLAFEVTGLPDNIDKDWICVSGETFEWFLECILRLRELEDRENTHRSEETF